MTSFKMADEISGNLTALGALILHPGLPLQVIPTLESWSPLCNVSIHTPSDGLHVVNNAQFNVLKPRQNGRHFADDIFKCIFFNENAWIQIEISLNFVL